MGHLDLCVPDLRVLALYHSYHRHAQYSTKRTDEPNGLLEPRDRFRAELTRYAAAQQLDRRRSGRIDGAGGYGVAV